MDLHSKFEKITSLDNNNNVREYIEKRFTTCFIGALDSVEQCFYDLFTDTEWQQYWPELRETILNKGNREKRLAIKELDKYNFTKRGQKDRNYNK